MNMTMSRKNIKTGKGNIPINISMVKRTENGQVIQDLPLTDYQGQKVPLFTVITPKTCQCCDSNLKVHQHYANIGSARILNVVHMQMMWWLELLHLQITVANSSRNRNMFDTVANAHSGIVATLVRYIQQD